MALNWTMGLPSRARLWKDHLEGSYWMLPAVLTVLAGAVAVASLALDIHLQQDGRVALPRWLEVSTPDAARAVLTTIAGSMATLASLTYSLTLVALTMASGQYGPRLLRGFMRDRVTQVGLGAFVATFTFSLLVLRMVGTGDRPGDVPHLSVSVAMALALVSLGYLLFFVHHVSISINAAWVIRAVLEDIEQTLIPDSITGEADIPVPDPPRDGLTVRASRLGHVTMVDYAVLISAARAADTQVWLLVRAGDFVARGEPVACVPPHTSIDEDSVRGAVTIGSERTLLQDPEFGVRQLVEIALRALSPAVNDPYTALASIERLGPVIARLAERPPPLVAITDDEGVIRVWRRRVTRLDGVIRAAFHPLRQTGAPHVAVLIHLVDALGRIAAADTRHLGTAAIRAQLEMIADAASRVPAERDRADIEQRLDSVRARLHDG